MFRILLSTRRPTILAKAFPRLPQSLPANFRTALNWATNTFFREPRQLSRYRDWTAEELEFNSLLWQTTFSPQGPDRLWGSHSLVSNGHRELFPRLKLKERGTDRSPPCSAQVKNGGATPPLPPMSSWTGA
jgi:hypothetical protein